MSEAPSRPRLYIDTNVFIYAVESQGELALSLQGMFEAFRRLSISPVTSELTLAELLCNRELSPRTQRVYMNLIVYKKLFDLRSVSRSILLGSAALRRDSPACKLADAIHVQTALDAHCTMVMTNDLRFGHYPAALTLVRPTADGISSVLSALHE